MGSKDAIHQIQPDEMLQNSFSDNIGTVIEARSKVAHSRHLLPKFELDCQSKKGWRLTTVHIAVRGHVAALGKGLTLTLAIAAIPPLGYHRQHQSV